AYVPVALIAIDELSKCGSSPAAVNLLARLVADPAAAPATDPTAGPAAGPAASAAAGPATSAPQDAAAPGLMLPWHRVAHGLVALAGAAPDRAAPALSTFSKAPIWQLRMYAARAAAVLKDRAALEAGASDQDDNVREEAIEGLSKLAGHD